MVFCKAMEIDTKFYGGVMSAKHIEKLKNWFYYGFAQKFELYVRKIVSVGQRLPFYWEQKMADLMDIVAARQMGSKRPDGTTLISGVRYEYNVNTYHMPVWYEYVGNYILGNKCSGCHNVKTGRKDKDRFTAQFSIGKGGNKLIPFIIFKDEDTVCYLRCQLIILCII